MQLEIDRLRRRQRCERRRRTPSDFDPSSDDDGDGSYRPRSRTPPNESFSYDEDRYYKRRSKSPSHEGLGNDTMSRALNQISKSLFTCRVEGGKLPQRFTQPAFTNESFSYDENRYYKQRSKSPSREGLDNDTMSRALK